MLGKFGDNVIAGFWCKLDILKLAVSILRPSASVASAFGIDSAKITIIYGWNSEFGSAPFQQQLAKIRGLSHNSCKSPFRGIQWMERHEIPLQFHILLFLGELND